jgi:hydroxyethylthiazole kinase-like uncharacterized protein yjeF
VLPSAGQQFAAEFSILWHSPSMSVPVISVAQMRQWEQTSWDAGRSQIEVINLAGAAVARAASKLTRDKDCIVILAGKGHNGDDARCAQPHLKSREVHVLNVENPEPDMERLQALLSNRPALVIDGLFGIGLNRPLDTAWAQFIERLNRTNSTVLAVDVPSGLNADSGEPQNIAVCAHTTITLGAPKRGLLLPVSYPFVGRLEVASHIGLAPFPFTEELQWSETEDFTSYPPPRRVDGHKGSFGHVAIFAGSEGYHGAAVMAARGALRARPGLVSVFCERHVYTPIASLLQAAMVHTFAQPLRLPPSCTAVVICPGLGAGNLVPAW